MGRTHTTKDGFKLEVFSSMYVDWGLSIERDGKDLFSNPCCLSNECYGLKPAPQYEDWDEAEVAAMDGDDNAFVPWTDADWRECLEREAETLIEAYLGHDIWAKVEQSKKARAWAKRQARWVKRLNCSENAAYDTVYEDGVPYNGGDFAFYGAIEGLARAAVSLDPFLDGEDDCHVMRDTLEGPVQLITNAQKEG